MSKIIISQEEAIMYADYYFAEASPMVLKFRREWEASRKERSKKFAYLQGSYSQLMCFTGALPCVSPEMQYKTGKFKSKKLAEEYLRHWFGIMGHLYALQGVEHPKMSTAFIQT